MTTTMRHDYPHYHVEGRRFTVDDYCLAVHFARDLATRMAAPSTYCER